jgi:hypothetical protein
MNKMNFKELQSMIDGLRPRVPEYSEVKVVHRFNGEFPEPKYGVYHFVADLGYHGLVLHELNSSREITDDIVSVSEDRP